MITINVNRIVEGHKQTLGHGTLFVNGSAVFDFCTLELPNKHNQRNVSSIPTGEYNAERITRGSNGKGVILLHNVPGRSSILIHLGNFYSDIEGCILVGSRFKDVNNDGIVDVIESTKTKDTLLSYINKGDSITVKINKVRA